MWIDMIRERFSLYCLSDSCYSDLSGLKLLPLADGTFIEFDTHFGVQEVHLCSTDCPHSLLPNLDHLLVDVSDDQEFYKKLKLVAESKLTRLSMYLLRKR